MTETAMTIYQRFLDAADAALLAGDVDGFVSRSHLPHVVTTEDDIILIRDIAKAERVFRGVHNGLKAQGVDGSTRVACTAHFVDPDMIEARHETFITTGGKMVVPPFLNEITLARRDGRWGSVRTRHHTRYVSWPNLLPRGGKK